MRASRGLRAPAGTSAEGGRSTGPAAGSLTISVVIPVLDDATMLQRCLQSLTEQNVSASEVVVVDNGSSDRTAEVAAAYGAVLIQEQRRGIGHAAAAGYDAASGQIIARCDADSVLPPDWLQRIGRTFVEHDEVGAVSGPGRFYDVPVALSWCGAVLYMRLYFAVMWVTLGHAALFGSNTAFRADAWRAVRDHVHTGTDVHDDIDLSYHLGRVAVLRYDRSLRVGISGRPLLSRRGLVVRWRRGVRSVVLHWPQDVPWKRWARRNGHVDRVPRRPWSPEHGAVPSGPRPGPGPG
ncbi:glycosyltransferase family 2 protein [Cellulomonas sp. URHE0023]|uniref:glycosyltransferase family 2 protein n=1 Tax=Cellulomonas sp. URHE0023 TaxID=1380354 RepID=UPI000690267D|nr:glycosyltransferase family 2 protein [Cellulomonas sp. URHE0023]